MAREEADRDKRQDQCTKCRLCFEIESSLELRISITEDIKTDAQELLQLELEQTACCSNWVCRDCNTKLNNFSTFRREILEKQKNLDHFHRRVKSEPQVDVFQDLPQEIPVIKKEENCSSTFEHFDIVEVKLEPIFEDRAENETSNFNLCEETENLTDLSFNSNESKSLQENTTRRKKSTNAEQGRIICEFCGQEMNKPSLNRHIEAIHLKTVNAECDKCGKTFYSLKNLRRHIVMHIPAHNRVKNIQCDECSKYLSTTDGLRHHKKIAHSSTPVEAFSCHCGKSFTAKVILNHHINRVHKREENSVQCKFCEKILLKYDLKRHITSHHSNVRNYMCNICGKFYVSASRLTGHKKQAHGDKKFACEHKDCGKRFAEKSALILHNDFVHKKIKSFVCSRSDCSNAYSSKQKLDKHVAIFHDKLRQNCPINGCNFSVGRIDYMRNHIKKHSELKNEELQHYLTVIKTMKLV